MDLKKKLYVYKEIYFIYKVFSMMFGIWCFKGSRGGSCN